MAFDYCKLRGRIKEKCGTQAVFANLLGISEPTMSKKLGNESEFTQIEINKACEILEIDPNMIPKYFFTRKV